ncbi:MAG: plastocyanin/azurin family copper-binding protein [Gemmatimonadaceae bacterium]
MRGRSSNEQVTQHSIDTGRFSVRSRWLVLGVVACAAACGGSDSVSGTSGGSGSTGGTGGTGGAQPVSTTSVSMSGLQFSPASISVAPGATVTWTNKDNTAHNVTFSNSSVASIGDFSSGSESTTMPSAPGSYSYQCTIHPGMNGIVVVQ